MNHNLTQTPDRFRIIDDRNGSSQPLNPTANVNGDWYFNQSSRNLYYMGKTTRLFTQDIYALFVLKEGTYIIMLKSAQYCAKKNFEFCDYSVWKRPCD